MNIQLDHEFPEDSIPLPLIEFSGGPISATIASPADSLNSFRRSAREKIYGVLSVAWILKASQRDAFLAFWEELGNGTSCFSISLRYPDNAELTDWKVRFASGFRTSYLGRNWRVEAELELISEMNIPETT